LEIEPLAGRSVHRCLQIYFGRVSWNMGCSENDPMMLQQRYKNNIIAASGVTEKLYNVYQKESWTSCRRMLRGQWRQYVMLLVTFSLLRGQWTTSRCFLIFETLHCLEASGGTMLTRLKLYIDMCIVYVSQYLKPYARSSITRLRGHCIVKLIFRNLGVRVWTGFVSGFEVLAAV
jgi:hypothetical protein